MSKFVQFNDRQLSFWLGFVCLGQVCGKRVTSISWGLKWALSNIHGLILGAQITISCDEVLRTVKNPKRSNFSCLIVMLPIEASITILVSKIFRQHYQVFLIATSANAFPYTWSEKFHTHPSRKKAKIFQDHWLSQGLPSSSSSRFRLTEDFHPVENVFCLLPCRPCHQRRYDDANYANRPTTCTLLLLTHQS